MDLGFNLSGGIQGVFDAQGMEYLLGISIAQIFDFQARTGPIYYPYLYITYTYLSIYYTEFNIILYVWGVQRCDVFDTKHLYAHASEI